jgi:hypothetical protein
LQGGHDWSSGRSSWRLGRGRRDGERRSCDDLGGPEKMASGGRIELRRSRTTSVTGKLRTSRAGNDGDACTHGRGERACRERRREELRGEWRRCRGVGEIGFDRESSEFIGGRGCMGAVPSIEGCVAPFRFLPYSLKKERDRGGLRWR